MTRGRGSWMLLAALVAQLACADGGIDPGPELVPEATEPLELTLRTRRPVFGERFPQVEMTSVPRGIRVRVVRPDLNCTLAQAWVGREPGVLNVVARVGGNPLALCAGGFVVEYSGVVEAEAGSYTVRVYEALGDGTPRRLRTRNVLALPAAP